MTHNELRDLGDLLLQLEEEYNDGRMTLDDLIAVRRMQRFVKKASKETE